MPASLALYATTASILSKSALIYILLSVVGGLVLCYYLYTETTFSAVSYETSLPLDHTVAMKKRIGYWLFQFRM